ncbi:hypothetical protein STEG23_010861, partial [Scotinomys teguina]
MEQPKGQKDKGASKGTRGTLRAIDSHHLTKQKVISDSVVEQESLCGYFPPKRQKLPESLAL